MRRVNISPQDPQPQLPPAVDTTPASAPSSVPTVPIPSGRDRAESTENPVATRPPPRGTLSTATPDLDALGAAAEFQFGESAVCYLLDDWDCEQHAEPMCQATMRHIILGRPLALPTVLLFVFNVTLAPLLLDFFRSLLVKAASTPPNNRSDILVRKPNPPHLLWLAATGGTRGMCVERRVCVTAV